MNDDGAKRPASKALWVGALLLGIGLLARLAPLLDAGGRMLRQFPTEDGYLMLTIARNIALGKGMSVSDGLQPTNGTQPLMTLISAAVFWLADGDRRLGVLGVLLLDVIWSCAAATAIYALMRRLLGAKPFGTSAALVVSAAWFASPLSVAHSMNCLETGLYALVVILVALAFAESPSAERWSVRRCASLGALLGLAFWTRNDAVFLVLAGCLLHVGWGFYDSAKPVTRRFGESLLFGATSVAIAAPWLIFNLLRFGAIVPVSGRSEALEGRFAENLWRIPIAIFEYTTLYLPVPGSLEQDPWVLAAATVASIAVTALAAQVFRSGSPEARAVTALGAIFAACLLAFYGLHFGAGYFFSRYVFSVSPLLALLTGAALRRALQIADGRGWKWLPAAAALATCTLALALNARLYRNGTAHMHFQVVEWVQQHVSDDAWVAAPQSGTLGFFHDRTINLDGKVNPAALAARHTDGNATRYFLERRQIEYLADWEGIASWAKVPSIAAEFELVVDDPARNLAVLRRRNHTSQP
jgi:hypothetical protein